jgi:hypothetical protein
MRSEQVYWVFTVTVDQMDKFKSLVQKLVAATDKEPGALQFECNVGDDSRTRRHSGRGVILPLDWARPATGFNRR